MINNVLLNKVDFKKNISKALFTIKFLNKKLKNKFKMSTKIFCDIADINFS